MEVSERGDKIRACAIAGVRPGGKGQGMGSLEENRNWGIVCCQDSPFRPLSAPKPASCPYYSSVANLTYLTGKFGSPCWCVMPLSVYSTGPEMHNSSLAFAPL